MRSVEAILPARRSGALFVLLALGQGGLVLLFPHPIVVGAGMWWNANTIAHNFIHRPFFRDRALRAAFSIYLSLLLGAPQSIWRERHLAHHAGRRPAVRWSPLLAAEVAALGALWSALALVNPAFLLLSYLPAIASGLCLCWLHGYYEHERGTVSHYGRVYNFLFFNDGYHREHHARPGLDWRDLPQCRMPDAAASSSRWPAVLRWLEGPPLEMLERGALHLRPVQRWLVRCHARAFRRLLAGGSPGRVGIVGGGLFPRTALALREVLPAARLTIIDGSAEHLALARRQLGELDGVEHVHAWFDPALHCAFDVLVVPLSYRGDRTALYATPPAPVVLVHDWIWRRRGRGKVISVFLLKRLNRLEA